MAKIKLIAEIGLNHGGSLKRAKSLVSLAKSSNVWGVKFQYFKRDSLFNLNHYTRLLNLKNNFAHYIDNLLLSDSDFTDLILYTISLNLPFGISFFSSEDLINYSLFFKNKTNLNLFEYVKFLKIASGEITDVPLLIEYSNILKKYNIYIVISTGISNDVEIENAISILDPYKKFKEKIILLHCKVEYPSKYEIANLKRIKILKEKFGYNSGLSDHSPGIDIPLLSLQFIPEIIEKHFTDNKNINYADNPISTEADDFKKLSFILNNYSNIIGDGNFQITLKEKNEIKYSRKGIYAKKNISIGEVFDLKNIITQRPNLEMNDAKYFNFIYKKRSKNKYKKGDPIIIEKEK